MPVEFGFFAAKPLLEEADAYWRDLNPASRWAGEAALWLGRAYLALGQNAEAGEAFNRAERILLASPLPADAELARLARRI